MISMSNQITDGPLISIVTPSYNSADTIEETIRSVHAQTYPHVEHIVVDGGSTDGTVDILRRHPHLIWVSEKDEGQAYALNKGFRMARGELMGWLNADDTYEMDMLQRVARLFAHNPGADRIHGDMVWIDERGQFIRRVNGREFEIARAILSNPINQQAAFFRSIVFDQIGYLRTDLHYVMDYEFWLRVGARFRSLYVPEVWASFRMVQGTKSVSHPEQFWLEILKVYDDIFSSPDLPDDLVAIKALAYGRMYWLTATALCRLDDYARAKDRVWRALVDYDFVAEDYAAFVSACRYIEAHEFDPPGDPDWIEGLIQVLPQCAKQNQRLIREMRSFFYATRADYWFSRSNLTQVRKDTIRAIWYNPSRWLRNRGFLQRGFEAWAGRTVTNVVRRAFHQLAGASRIRSLVR